MLSLHVCAQSCFALLAPSPLGKVKALEIMMLQLAPVECRPRSALMHWESLRGLGMSLGDVVAVWAEETVATPLLLSVWASGAVAVGRVGLSEEARAALGRRAAPLHPRDDVRRVSGTVALSTTNCPSLPANTIAPIALAQELTPR